MRILLVDDATGTLHTFAHLLKLVGHTVITARSGREGLALYHQEQPDIVLLDLRPDTDGLAVLQAIREHDPEANVILCAGQGEKDAAITALRAGASDLLPQPIDQVALESALRRAEERVHLKRELRAAQEALQQQNERLDEQVKARSAELESEIQRHLRAETAMRESEGKYRTLFETMAQGVVYQDAEGRIISANPAAERILGLSLDQMLGRTSTDPRWHAIREDGSEFSGEKHPSMVALETGKEVKNVVMGVFNPQTGECRWINVHATPQFRMGQDVPYQVHTTFDDITERKQLARALEERQLYLEGVLSAVPDAIVTTDIEHRVLEWNRGAERLFGYSREEVIGQELDLLVAGSDPGTFDQATGFTQQVLSGQPVPPTEAVRYRKDGTPVNVILAGAPIQIQGQLVGVVAAYTDITQRKWAEEALKESESKLRGMLSSMADHVFAFDSEGHFTFFHSLETEDLYVPPDEFIGKRHVDVMPPLVNELFIQALERNKEGMSADYEYRLELEDEIRWFSAKLSPRFVDGDFAGSVAVVRNITRRKRMEEALRESEERYRTILETIEEGYYEVDIAGSMTFFNPALSEILGYPEDELMGMNNWEYMDSETAKDVYQAFNEVYRTGKPAKAFDWEVIQKDGTRRVIEASVSLVHNREGDPVGFRGMLRDVTERKRIEQELRERTEQLEALREIALGISAQLELGQLLHSIVERGCQLLDVGGGSLYLVDEERGDLEQVVSHGYKEDHTGTHIAPGEGIAGRVLQRGEPLTVDDYKSWEGRSADWVDEELTGSLGVPLCRGERVIGTLGFDEIAKPRRFDERDIRLAALFANQAAIAIKNAQLFEETQRRALEQETLREAALTMTTALERDKVVERILAQLQEVVPYDTASVQLLRHGLLEIVGGRGFPNLEELLGITFDPSRKDNPNREVIRDRAPFIVEDAPAVYQEFRCEPHAQAGIRSWLGVPMLVGDQLIGMIALDRHEPGFYTEEHAQLAEAFAAQAAIAIENARLYEEVRRQADELKAAVDQLRELDRLKSEFIQNVSHELRSPLALIRGYAEMLDAGDLGEMLPMQEEPIAIIARRARMLSALVQDITLILEAEVNPPEPEPVALDELARAAVEDFQISADEAELTLEMEIASGLSPVRGALTHLRRVLDNLIENAIKFTTPQGRVTVRVRQLEEDQVLLEVSDTGIGIRPDQQDLIFERFYQVDGSARRRYRGTGLGLALVKEIVENYGGQIRVESDVGQGTTFAVTLPVFRQDDRQPEGTRGT
jgi:PAS domain S-box-containing protein